VRTTGLGGGTGGAVRTMGFGRWDGLTPGPSHFSPLRKASAAKNERGDSIRGSESKRSFVERRRQPQRNDEMRGEAFRLPSPAQSSREDKTLKHEWNQDRGALPRLGFRGSPVAFTPIDFRCGSHLKPDGMGEVEPEARIPAPSRFSRFASGVHSHRLGLRLAPQTGRDGRWRSIESVAVVCSGCLRIGTERGGDLPSCRLVRWWYPNAVPTRSLRRSEQRLRSRF
jgi:hypothetical protein